MKVVLLHAPPGSDLSPPGLARLVADLIADDDDVLLVGNDTGGAIAQLVAAHHPERLSGLVLTNCDAYERFFPPLFRPLQLAARVPGGVEALAWAREDRRVFPPSIAERLAGDFPNARIEWIEDSWTFVPEDRPPALAAIVRAAAATSSQ